MPLYFAFGSNMDTDQMARRCPGTEPVGRATLADHRLVFRGPSRNRGGGVLSVDASPDDTVTGVLYAVGDEHLLALDRYEGAPEWYLRMPCSVVGSDGRAHDAILYRLPGHVTEMPPTAAYLTQVAAAFGAHGLDPAPLHDATDRARGA